VSIMEENSVRCSFLDEMRKAFGHFDKVEISTIFLF
jgi:hypothetical protein